MSVARLRLATRTNLEDLETNQSQQASQNSRRLHPLHRDKSPDRERDRVPRTHFHVGQIVYDPDRKWSMWKRMAFRGLYLPLFRFFDWAFKFFPPTRKEPSGAYSWLADQGCFFTEEEAQADAARYPFGYVVPDMPLGRSLKADSDPEESNVYFMNKEGKQFDLRGELNKVNDELDKVLNSARAG